jgi:tetratricopeptide (TPR) repeat protein
MATVPEDLEFFFLPIPPGPVHSYSTKMKKWKLVWVALLLPLWTWAQTGEPELADKYFQDAEYENALQLYEKLQKKEPDNRVYNLRIADCHQKLGQYGEAAASLEKAARRNPYDYYYPFVLADAYRLQGEFKKAESTENEVIAKKLQTEADFMEIGAWLADNGKNELALKAYHQGRKTLKSKYVFADEIAHLYKLTGEWGLAAEEYLEQYYLNPSMINSIKTNLLTLVNDRSKDVLEKVLLDAVGKNGKDVGLRTMVFEFYVLSENFYEALVQVKSIDKVNNEDGGRVFQYALTLRNNKAYKMSNKALDYVIEAHDGSSYYMRSFQEKAVNGELQAFETLPVDTAGIREAVNAYNALFERFGRRPVFFDAMYRKSKLMAFYLFDLDGALAELDLATKQQLKPQEMAQVNLLIGDVLLMQKEYNRAKLKYNEVAEAWKEGQIGAEAKYKQGRLSYFKGDFEYSKARLQTIKDNTSNDISNDAIQLFLLIQDNLGLDTTTYPLERFAQAQLMVYQRDFAPALELLDSIAYAFPSNTLADEIVWEKANIYLQQNQIDKALNFLEKIIAEHPTDIYGDDALYTKAKIYDYTLKDKAKAMELYITFLKTYTGSLFIVEVRNRIRELRNDTPTQPEAN